jgi:glycosyltransferase involved in cell wall biosynthesis
MWAPVQGAVGTRQIIENRKKDHDYDIIYTGATLNYMKNFSRFLSSKIHGYLGYRLNVILWMIEFFYLKFYRAEKFHILLVATPVLLFLNRNCVVILEMQGFPLLKVKNLGFRRKISGLIRLILLRIAVKRFKNIKILVMSEWTKQYIVRCEPNFAPIIEVQKDKLRVRHVKRNIGKLKVIEPIKLATCGRLTFQKNYGELIEAIKKSNLDIRLDIFGEGELKCLLVKKCLSLGVEQKIVFRGEMPNWLDGDFHAYISSSKWEDPGHAILEACASGLPIIGGCDYGLPLQLAPISQGLFLPNTGVDTLTRVLENLSSENISITLQSVSNAQRSYMSEYFLYD